MNARERIAALLAGEAPDRPAFALWRHFPGADSTPQGLAEATIAFARRWKPDIVKHTPSGMYAVEDWAEGLAALPPPPEDTEGIPYTLNLDVDWRALAPLDVRAGALGRELEALRLVCRELKREAPVYMTVFGPLTLAGKLRGRRILADMKHDPEGLQTGLATIAATVAAYVAAVRDAGAEGLYLATQYASSELLDPATHDRFGAPHDLRVLAAWERAGPVILHLCGADIFFDLANSYPVDAVCWDHGLSAPGFAEAFDRTDRVVVAGMIERTFPLSASGVAEEARAALAVSSGRRHILAPTCVIPNETADEALSAVIESVATTS